MTGRFWRSLRFAGRLLAKQPGQSALAVFALGLGIGLVSTQFSLTDGILLRGLPFKNSGRILHVSRLNPQTLDPKSWEVVPYRDFEVFRVDQTVFAHLAGIASFAANVSQSGGAPMSTLAAHATANLLDVLSVHPAIGRWFATGEDRPGQPARVVLSHRLWNNDFGADPAVLGKALTINGEAATIIGVMPEGFMFPSRQMLWTNLRQETVDPRERTAIGVEMVGLRRPGVTTEQVRASLEGIAARLAERYPETNTGYVRLNAQSFTQAYAGTGTEALLFALMAMTTFVLLLACANVANLLLARASRRTREMAVRQALGAGRVDIVRQLLGESVLLAALGAVLGIGLAYLGTAYLQHTVVQRMQVPFWFDFRVDHRVLLFIVGLTLISGLLAGLMPAWKASRVDVNEALKDESRGASGLHLSRFFRWLVAGQVNLSCALLIAAGIQAVTVAELRKVNLGFDPHHLMMGRLEIQDSVYVTPGSRVRFYDQLLQRVRDLPGVSAAAVSSRDLIGGGVGTRCEIEGRVYLNDTEKPTVQLEVISPDYFRTIAVSILDGRVFDRGDDLEAPPVALVNESFAARFWPGESAIGKRVRHNQIDAPWATVVGVVPDLHMSGVVPGPSAVPAGFYLCQDQKAWGWLYLLVRTHADPTPLIDDLREVVASLDPQQPIHSFGTLQWHTETQLNGFQVVGTQVLVFGLVTIFLGAVGIYGVTAFSVAQRTREFGVRMAMGATMGSILKLVFRQGALQILVGLSVGTMLAVGLTFPIRVFTAAGVSVDHGPIFLVVILLVLGISAAAMWFPARRAAAVHPLKALRHE